MQDLENNQARAGEWLHDYLAPVALPFLLPTSVYGAMLVVWHLRPVLQRRFPLQEGRKRDYLRFLAWCAFEGRRQYAILRSIKEWDLALTQPIDLPPLNRDRWAGAFSVGMFLLGAAKQHYAFGAMLEDPKARNVAALAFWRGERHTRSLPPPAAWQRADLAQRFESPRDLIKAIRIKRTDIGKPDDELLEAFGLWDVVDDLTLAAQARANGRSVAIEERSQGVAIPARIRRSPIALHRRAVRSIGWLLERFGGRPSEREAAKVTGLIPLTRRPKPIGKHPFGVNLFGYARGELGIGEDVRLVAMALKANGIPFNIVNIQLGADVSQADESVAGWMSDAPRYAINIFCVTGIELGKFACERGLDAFQGRYTIGLWPWELPAWPTSCRYAYSVVDEIWGISAYTAGAFRDAPCPVRTMTLPVIAEPVSTSSRADFGLPPDTYLYIFSFDINSTLARKNPDGVIRAFEKAFPRKNRENVGLVLKVNHAASAKGKQWNRIRQAIARNPRIHLIDKTLRKPDVLALYRCCDCFVSLHRAEGFGRGLAEALLLGKQLVATDFSGNRDFCSGSRVGLVPYKMKTLRKGDYFHGEGQQWAEPDVAQAAEQMRNVKIRPLEPNALVHDFSPKSVGLRYAERLHEIYHQLTVVEKFEC